MFVKGATEISPDNSTQSDKLTDADQSSKKSNIIRARVILQEMSKITITQMSLKLTYSSISLDSGV